MVTIIRWVVALLAGVTILLIAPAPQASAHPLSTTAVLLDVSTERVTARVDLPLDELSIALDNKLTAATVLAAPTLELVRAYVQGHMSATDDEKRAWTTTVAGGRVARVDGVDNLVLDATLTPGSGTTGNFVFHYDAIIDKLISHRIFVSGRYGDSGSYTTLAMLSWQSQSVPVESTRSASSDIRGFMPAIRLGIHHIGTGSDHLLFLVMLLLPAPLAARGRRWVRRDDLGRAGFRVVHVVTAFAIGHSITLALGALDWVHLPTRLVESGIALSVLVSAVHAIRPLVRRGEIFIAGSFGLLHGLSFAALLGELDLNRSALVTTLLGFNVGIELTQLLVVALVMPSLIVLSRTVAYPAVRTGAAAVGAVLAAAWLTERTGLLSRNRLEPVSQVLVSHPFALAAALAVLAITFGLVQRVGHGPEPARLEDRTDEPSPLAFVETS
jgi:HupE / UreJ protein